MTLVISAFIFSFLLKLLVTLFSFFFFFPSQVKFPTYLSQYPNITL